jgi:hypothetical protein
MAKKTDNHNLPAKLALRVISCERFTATATFEFWIVAKLPAKFGARSAKNFPADIGEWISKRNRGD